MKKRNTVFSLAALSVFIVSVTLGIATAGDEPNGKPDYLPTQDFEKMDENMADGDWWLLRVLIWLYNAVSELQNEIEALGAAILWTDAEGYIYPNNVGTNFTITDTGNLSVPGNVGIGTAEPKTKLDIRGGFNIANGPTIVPGAMYASISDEPADYDEEFVISMWSGDGPKGDDRSSIFIGPNSDTGGVGRIELDARTVFIDKANVGIGTMSPTEKLQVAGKVKAKEFVTGDITFEKNNESLWRMFEDEDGLYLENLKTGKVYRFVLQEVENEKKTGSLAM